MDIPMGRLDEANESLQQNSDGGIQNNDSHVGSRGEILEQNGSQLGA